MAATVEYYDDLIDSFGDSQSLTLLVVAGATRDCVAKALEVDLHEPVIHPWDADDEADFASWALVEIDGGVIGVEYTGYADPTVDALRLMSRNGGAAAVVRSNVEAQLRFGCARDAEVLLDAGQDLHVDDPDQVPSELRPLFDRAHNDSDADAFVVGLAMAEVVTGLELTSQEALLLASAQFFRGPTLAVES
ncbi:hypothetical protein F0U44_11955 [Nocardioides humilatus]|uniref:Uncharacterized protein n=1 Tax=Nocardioides humilatus TaxID=2607660 RepID=A0A5B1LHP7_9ACTN|nr:hypothetical protein [Nocardioides humilatus]KAA1419159.1 hypothetical protein F0U44_11955 [Nocardioides humilatus]